MSFMIGLARNHWSKVIPILLLCVFSISGLRIYAQSDDVVTNTDHADLISKLDEDTFKEGKKIYRSSCVTCHGKDGSGNMPAARSFTDDTFKNGADPYSMYKTVSNGYKQMPGQSWLSASRRYAVIHYIREAFLKKENPEQYVEVTEEYLSGLPEVQERKTSDDQKVKKSDAELFQGALVSQLGEQFPVVLSVAAGNDVTISYDLHRMRTAATWEGGFLDLTETKIQKLRGEGEARPDGKPIKGLQNWYWAYGNEMNYDRLDLDPRSPAPDKWMTFEGRYTHGDRTTLHYTINGREVLETPDAKQTSDFLSLNHTLRIEPGAKPLTLVAGNVDQPVNESSGVMSLENDQIEKSRGSASGHLAVAATNQWTASGPFFSGSDSNGSRSGFVAAGVAGQTDNLTWKIDDHGRIILSIPPGKRSRVIRVMRFANRNSDQLDRFQRYVNHVRQNKTITDPKQFTEPGPNPFSETVQVEGELSEKDHGYVVDTIPVPIRDNPYGAWIRPSALAFYDDGRAAVATYTGDVWIVSGLDGKLNQVTWRRFATGFFEPLGARVIDGTLHLTCRDGIKRVHDYNNDGYADHVEQVYSDHDVSTNYLGFLFGLEHDPKGNFYMTKSGRYTDFRLPGAVIKVSPDGDQHEVMAIGFRVPNGIGSFPHNGKQYVTVSDNQGHYIPASKINIIERGAFYGYSGKKRQWHPYGGKVDPREGEFPPDSFHEPMLWIPHKVDNSSGGQVWVDDKRFGPLNHHMIHSSFGSARLYYVLPQNVNGTWQAGIVPFPQRFDSGVMRVRVNPSDGQVYTVGLTGINDPPDPSEGCFQRLRYAGDPVHVIKSMSVTSSGLKLTFNVRVGSGANHPENYNVRQWEYKWTENYGSARYHPDTMKKGEESVTVNEVKVGPHQKSIHLNLNQLHEVQQMHVELDVPVANGDSFQENLYLTINKVPEK